MIGAIVEHVSEHPTISPGTQASEPGITPGGLDPANNVPTLGKMQAGALVSKWVVTIEGCPYVPSDAPQAAVQAAYADTDFASSTTVEVFVYLHNSQSIAPFQPFATQGKCQVKVFDPTDAFATFVARRQGGDETTLTADADFDDTTISVKSTSEFASSGNIYIGSECIGYTGTTSTSFTGCTRGKYSPLGTADSGMGGRRFANHHAVTVDVNQVQVNPVVSSIPQSWIGKRVAVRLHTWNEPDQALNTVDNAQLVFTGRIAGITDDPDSFCTVLDLEHEMTSVKDAVIGDDIWHAEIPEGVSLIEGRTFSFVETIMDSPAVTNTATDLVVVSGTPASVNEIQAGRYTATQLVSALNAWLASELAATRIDGYYSWNANISTNDGIRTRCTYNVPYGSDKTVVSAFMFPVEVFALLGIENTKPDPETGRLVFSSPASDRTNTTEYLQGTAAPFSTLVFKVYGPSLYGGGFSTDSLTYDADNERGTFAGQYDYLPASVKAYAQPDDNWGLFMLDEKVLIVGYYNSSTRQLQNCAIAPFRFAQTDSTSALEYIGRRVDDRDAGPVTVRQVFVLVGPLSELWLKLAYSTGVAGYNHATYDALPHGLGAGIPGEVLGGEFERALWNLPQADVPIALVIDEPTKLSELIGEDLNFRWAFLRWKDEHFEICQWRTPLNALAVATLSEANKAAPAGQEESHRAPSQETDEFQYSTIKIDYCRDFGFGRKGNFFKSVTFVDRSTASGRSITLSLRNTVNEFANTSQSVEAGLAQFAVHMPSVSRPFRRMVRSIDYTKFETLQPGDIVTTVDSYARDPLTGTRSVQSRAMMITRISYDLGGPTPNGTVRPIMGEVELSALDTQRGSLYAPSANVDYEATFGGFDKGYKSSTNTLRCRPHDYSHVITVHKRGVPVSVAEALDASNLAAGDVVDITERDPANTASPITWRRTIQSVSGNDVTFTSGLSAPAWDNTKKYRITYAPYTSCQSTQLDYAFQADDTDEMVQDTEIPYHFSGTPELLGFADNSPTYAAENIPDAAYGDGVPWDVATDRAIANTVNAFIDYKSAHQAPFLQTSAMGPVDTASTAWANFYCFQWFLGTEHLNSSLTRYAYAAPWFRSSTGGTAEVRVILTRTLPVKSAAEGFLPGETFRDPILNDAFVISDAWSTTSTTWGKGAAKALDIGATKDIFFGFVYVLVQGRGPVECRGLAEFYEGPRVVL